MPRKKKDLTETLANLSDATMDAVKEAAFLKKLEEEDERERRRAERKAQNPDGQLDPNTSRKKLKAQQKTEADAAAAAYAAERSGKTGDDESGEDKHFSGDPDRPYSRGRAYKADRYGRNTRDGAQEVPAEPAAAPEAEAPEVPAAEPAAPDDAKE